MYKDIPTIQTSSVKVDFRMIRTHQSLVGLGDEQDDNESNEFIKLNFQDLIMSRTSASHFFTSWRELVSSGNDTAHIKISINQLLQLCKLGIIGDLYNDTDTELTLGFISIKLLNKNGFLLFIFFSLFR